MLTQALLDVLDQMRATEQEKLNGSDLYQTIEAFLERRDSSLMNLVAELNPLVGKLPTRRWVKGSPAKNKQITLRGQPRNFPPFLVPIFCEEAHRFLQDRHFNPRIHLVNQGNRAPLQMLWRKEVLERCPYVNSLLVMDATADIKLLKPLLNINESYQPPLPEWPPNISVHQWGGDTVSKAKLGFKFESDNNGEIDEEKLEVWFERIKRALSPIDRGKKIGVISHNGLDKKLAEKLRSWGFKKVSSMYYFNLRGSNEFLKSHVLVMLGCPIPNFTGFEEECQAFFFDEPRPMIFRRNNKKQDLEMRDGRKYPVQVYGYWDEPASLYYRQKCHSELFQALHRIRPYITRRYKRDIFLFTNMPVDGVKVDEVISDCTDWKWIAAQKVMQYLETQGEVTITEIARFVDETQKTVENNGDAIAILAGGYYNRGARGRGRGKNRISKNPLHI